MKLKQVVFLIGFVVASMSATVHGATYMEWQIGIVIASPTVDGTATPTGTITPTKTISATHTVSPTISETSTFTPTMTSTKFVTITPTSTVSPTSTITVTSTISPTLTFTDTPTPIVTATPTITVTPTNTPTTVNTLQPSPSNTPSLTATHTPTTVTILQMSPSSTPSMTRTQTSEATVLDLGANQVRTYPNPSRGKVNFAYAISGSGKVVIDIYKLTGERIASITEQVNGGAGQTLSTAWDAINVAPGIYFCRIVITDGNGNVILDQKKKVALIK